MFYLYVLISKAGRHYIGISDNPGLRLVKHNSGSVISTKYYRPWKIAYVESYPNKTEARKREIFLKKTARARNDIFEKVDMVSSSNG